MNPFVLGNILPGEPFSNRKKEIEELTRYAINCTNVIIYSPRRYGKTSLARQVMHGVAKRGFLTVYVDLFSVTSKEDFIQKFLAAVVKSIGKDISSGSFIEKVKKLFSRITPSIEIRPDTISISARYESSASLSYLIEDIFKGLERYLSSKKMKCLIVFDEFQEITGLKESKHLEGILREHIQSQRLQSCFFVGSRRRILHSMFTDSKRPFFKMAFSYPIDKIPRAELVEYMRAQFKNTGKECPESIAEKVYDFAEGHTYYVQKLAHLLWDNTQKEASLKLLESAKKSLIQMESVDFQGIFSGLTNMEKKLVITLATEPTSKPYAKDYLAKHNFSLGGIQKSLKSLLDKDLAEIDRKKIYKLTDPLFARWCNPQLEW